MAFFPPLDIVARVVLFPVLAWQGLCVRRAVQELPEAEGPREGVSGEGLPLRLLIVGDSSAAGVGVVEQKDALSGQTVQRLATQFQVSWRLIAKTGATCQSTLEMLQADRALGSDQFDVVVIALGVNDAVRLRRTQLWLRRHRKLRRYLEAHYGVARLIVPGVPPVVSFPALTRLLRWVLGAHARRLDSALADDLTKEPNVEHIPFDLPLTDENMARDGYHPNEGGYAYCATMAATRIFQCFGEK